MNKLLESFFKPSAREYFRLADKHPDMGFFEKLHGYLYARYIYLYIGLGKGEHKLSKPLGWFVDFFNWCIHRFANKHASENGEDRSGFEDTYHGKVVTLEGAKKLVNINREVNLENLEHVIPYTLARDIVMRNPDHIAVVDCPCRLSKEDHCTPVDVCLIVGEPFASFILEHHPGKSRAITRDEAVDILKAEDARGHVHHAFFKDAMLGRFYAICNCCSCCCGAMQTVRNGTSMLACSGYVARIDEDACVGCGMCVESCQFEAITVIEKKAHVAYDACMGCGICQGQCPKDAVVFERDEAKGVPLEMDELIHAHDNAHGGAHHE